jgi:energy-coupling factor transporter ATP-binding protein EcfA2
MKKREIDAQFDEIVAFAEIERFLDTPVKRYSSGMYVRLAFAVAAHLQPEILIVDEVLAVGDADFQKKCLGKMREVVQGRGRTVIFVSHNMGAVTTLCTRALLLERGLLVAEGPSSRGGRPVPGAGLPKASPARSTCATRRRAADNFPKIVVAARVLDESRSPDADRVPVPENPHRARPVPAVSDAHADGGHRFQQCARASASSRSAPTCRRRRSAARMA